MGVGTWSRDELERAFQNYQDVVREAASRSNWSLFAELFTEDATYVEHAFGNFGGREEIRRWITATMSSCPGDRMPLFPVGWYIIDEERGWVVCQILNRMEDPGDGSIHEADNLTILHYAGDGLWSYEEDVYNPARFGTMLEGWRRAAEAAGGLPEDARAWFAALQPAAAS